MEQSPSWEANRFSATQEISRILWNPRVHYHIHKCLHLFLSWASSIQSIISTSYFLRIHLNIILLSTPGSSKWSLTIKLPHQYPVYASLLLIHATCLAHLILDFINRTTLGKEYRTLILSLCRFLHSSVTSSLSSPNNLLNTLFSNTLSVHASINVNDQVSHPNKTTGKIVVLLLHTCREHGELRWRKQLHCLHFICWRGNHCYLLVISENFSRWQVTPECFPV